MLYLYTVLVMCRPAHPPQSRGVNAPYQKVNENINTFGRINQKLMESFVYNKKNPQTQCRRKSPQHVLC